jgi:hypothetical protein
VRGRRSAKTRAVAQMCARGDAPAPPPVYEARTSTNVEVKCGAGPGVGAASGVLCRGAAPPRPARCARVPPRSVRQLRQLKVIAPVGVAQSLPSGADARSAEPSGAEQAGAHSARRAAAASGDAPKRAAAALATAPVRSDCANWSGAITAKWRRRTWDRAKWRRRTWRWAATGAQTHVAQTDGHLGRTGHPPDRSQVHPIGCRSGTCRVGGAAEP